MLQKAKRDFVRGFKTVVADEIAPEFWLCQTWCGAGNLKGAMEKLQRRRAASVCAERERLLMNVTESEATSERRARRFCTLCSTDSTVACRPEVQQMLDRFRCYHKNCGRKLDHHAEMWPAQ